ncbi:S49 family peptidase [Deinococcus murrayi]|uniref:S49 family peptidase n=1 Tax=Deinococcus murrayi TaxID=68910 RepID=UPI0006870AC4|nr:S49 family peptidase [Deinococcus murrayi]
MNTLQFLTRALSGEAWSITPQALEHLQNLVTSGQALKVETDHRPPQAAVQRVPLVRGNGKTVALVTFHGVVISRAPEWAESCGYVSPQRLAAQVRQLADDSSVAAIVLSIDSPGGTVAGTIEAADAVAYARTRKRVTACVNDVACSAAYWVASQASEIVVTPTAMTGSIGVIITHADYSKMLGAVGIAVTYIRSALKKALGQPYEPLSEDARAEFQATVDSIHTQFVQAVAKGRRKARRTVADTWATGEVWVGADAVTQGLADRVATLSTVIGEQAGVIAASEPPPLAPDPDEGEDDDPEARASPDPTATGSPPDAEQTSATEDPPPPPEAGSSTDPTPAPEAQEDPMNIAAISAKLASGELLTAEERRFLDDYLNAQQGDAPSTAGVDPSSLSPEVRALIDQANARAAAAERTANAERDNRLNREFRERALALGQPAAFGATLRAAHEKLSAEEYKALEQSLNATGAQLDLTGETGSSQDNRSSGNVQAEYERRVQAHIKEHPQASRAEAGRAVLAADPQFLARYRG